MNQIDFIASEYESVVITALTADYAPSIFKIIDENREHLNRCGERTGHRFESVDDVVDSIESAQNSLSERFVILSRGIATGLVSVTRLGETCKVMELGFWVGKQHTRQGIASAAARLLTDKVLERPDIEEVVAYARKDNLPSHSVLDKAGFIYLGLNDEYKKFAKNSAPVTDF